MINCKYCNKKLKTSSSFGVHSKTCKSYKKILNSITKDVLSDLYINQKMSAVDIQKHFGLHSHFQIYKKLKEFNIPVSLKESCAKSAKKREKTSLKNSGFKHNFCRNSPSRKAWEAKLLVEEGITNVFQRKDVKDKIKKSLVEKYKFESPQVIHGCRGKNVYSSVHRKIVEYLLNNNIKCDIEYKIEKTGSGFYYSYDIILTDTKKLIEIYGDYWHGNPKKYKKTDIILKGSSREMTVDYKRKFDAKKNRYAKKNGFDLLVIWEYDITNNFEKMCKKLMAYCKK